MTHELRLVIPPSPHLSGLSEDARERHAELELRMRESETSVENFAAALLTIRDEGLWFPEYQSFAEYCEERWGISRASAFRHLAYGETLRELPPDVNGTPKQPPAL